ncbi:MAG: single-stranded DNA-binding protein [Roseiarcus sp.]|jgi:single-stranded DNA-binding protein
MSVHVLVSGALYHAPESRTSKAGKPFVTATIRAKDGDTTQWWKVLAFSESAGAELLRLGDGDAVSVQGVLRVETYCDKDGETKISLTCIADAVLPLRPAPKSRTKDPAPSSKSSPDRDRLDRHGDPGPDEFGDVIPF